MEQKDGSGEPEENSEAQALQLYTKDDNGNFVPVLVEPATEEAESTEATMLLAMQRKIHVGPLPPAETLREYGEVVESAPERILCMAETEQKSTHEFIRSQIKNERDMVSQGQWMGFTTMIVALCGGVFAAYLGHVVFACALVSPAVITPIMRFYFRGKHEATSREPTEGEEDDT